METPMPPEPDDQADLLRRLMDHDRIVEDLEAEIAAAEAELKDMRKRLTSAVLARAKLSREIRKPRPILGDEGGAP
jgi:predicted  nucleic acid-binding Zn-ribbon protein